MRKRRYKSVIRRIVVLPTMVFSLFTLSVVILSIANFISMQNTIAHNNVSIVQTSMNQMENTIGQLETRFIQYIVNSDDYKFMQALDIDTPKEKYFTYQADTRNWLNDEVSSYREIEGAFAYYQNLGLRMFKGISNTKMHAYINNIFEKNKDVSKQSRVVFVDGEQYLLFINRYANFYNGYWMPVDQLWKTLGLTDKTLLGEVYFVDIKNKNTISNSSLNQEVVVKGREKEAFKNQGKTYQNYVIEGKDCDIYMGIMIPWNSIFGSIPPLTKVLLCLGFIVVLLTPILIIWLETKIAQPIKTMNYSMECISKGDMEYRIASRKTKYDDEFDSMFQQFNQMMDQLNELEFNLYKTQIQKQSTELKYISQQIRPHFILNALNIIYTYEEKDFELIQKMVLYLTDYFRYIVNLKVDFVELEKELRHVETYLNIQKERYQEWFDFFVEWENAVKEAMVPPLVIQTFVENCIKYGLKNEEKVFIYVLGSLENEKLKITIADTGNGFSEETIRQIRQFIETREYQDHLGIGIQNVIERMDILYDKRAEVKVRNALSGGAVVEIYLPLTID